MTADSAPTESIPATDADYPDASVRYGPTRSQLADIFEPAEPTDSLVILLHGGFWRESDRTRTWPVGRELSGAGHLTAAVEYRRGPGSWADAFDDVIGAIDEIGLSGREFTIGNDAPRVTTLVGHSAGGQLALWVAGRASLPEGNRWRTEHPTITGVVALAPIADLARAAELRLGDDAVAEFLGGTPEEIPEVYAVADPVRLAPAVDVHILHGADDVDVPVELSERYVAQAKPSGDSNVSLEVVDGIGHESWADPAGPGWRHLVGALDRVTARR
ncbi:alpha/beta hydrolase [Gordonia sp. VNK1]|uniref:alpha/beta hydrolase family protein n=1 Tax=Gordonia oleivorans TaxID=3156618 RepID=UPI0032B60491